MINNSPIEVFNNLTASDFLRIGSIIFVLIIFFVLIIGVISRIQEHKMYRQAKAWNARRNRSVKRK